MDISDRTLRRWTKGGQVHADQRPLVQRPEPRNKLSQDECATVPSICNSAEFSSLPPCRKIVGWEVHERESADLAAALIQKAVWAEACISRPLVLHADNGSPMKGATMRVTLEKLGIIASYSRPRVSNDNPVSEALFRTCKYRPDWPGKGFATKTDAQARVKAFAAWYDGKPLPSAIRFVTPNARHAGHEGTTLANRASLYAKARAKNPGRWSGKARNCQPAGPVWLNPEREACVPEIRDAA